MCSSSVKYFINKLSDTLHFLLLFTRKSFTKGNIILHIIKYLCDAWQFVSSICCSYNPVIFSLIEKALNAAYHLDDTNGAGVDCTSRAALLGIWLCSCCFILGCLWRVSYKCTLLFRRFILFFMILSSTFILSLWYRFPFSVLKHAFNSLNYSSKCSFSFKGSLLIEYESHLEEDLLTLPGNHRSPSVCLCFMCCSVYIFSK